MTDTDQTNDTVIEDSNETVVKKKASKKTRKKAVVKSTSEASEASTATASTVSETTTASETVAEPVESKNLDQSSEPASTATNDKRAQLINKLKDMGVMQGAAVANAAAGSKKILANNIPSWITPQVIAVAAGAAVFSVLIWSLENEKQDSQPQTANMAPIYAPYGAAPVMMHPAQPPAPMHEQAQQMNPYQPPLMEPPAYQVQQPDLPAVPHNPQSEQAPQAYPAPPAWYRNQYGYGYGYHPSMQFGFNSRMHGQGYGQGAQQYYGHPAYGPYPAPAYAYPPVGEQKR
ncbi:MAG: hypothetical protein OEY52_13490 [Gammaproteobacteria bacterium]|nr:hypothetical protein [Gammaproteobacteria bacterium]